MAIDGSFSLESALERFLTRCPKLGTRFDSLARKGKNLKEEEVVSKVAELFLHPHYTIPLVGCFRPVARKFVDKAVSLLSLVPNLRLNLDKRALELGLFTGIDDVDDIIEFHVKSGRGLNLHLLACLAFCRLLDLAPFLLGSVLTYFKFAPPPFELILTRGTVCELSMTVLQPYLNAARISYRLLLFEPDVFSKLWDWSCFLDLIEKFGNFRTYDDTGLKKEDIMDVRWCGIQILSVTLRMGDRAISNFGVKDEEALLCLLRWEEFCQDTALEKAGSYIESPDSMKLNSGAKDLSFNQENCLQCFGLNSVALSQLQEIRPSTRRRKVVTRDAKSDQNPFVLTSSVKRSFEVVLLAVSQKWPVLLYGVAGCGKSALISNLAQESGNQVLSIHMDDQIDSKTLIGSYVCTEQPGEFRWQPGSLTQAIQSGYWIVFEDIDKAPSDVQSILLPLLEGRSSYVTGHGEEIRVVESFRLFSTISTSKYDVSGGIEGANVISTLWRRVMIGPPSDDDMKNIVKSWYPSLEFLTERFIETYVSINSYPPYQLGGFQSRNSASNSSGSRFSLRDLLKWCKRIVELDFSANGNGLSAYVCQYIYREAVDVFASFSASAEKRLAMMKELASLWAIPEYVSETLYPSDEPTVQISPLELRIGRVTLQRPESVARLPEQSRQFVNIRSSLHLLERIACSIKYNEPVLLVGETGTGKTTVVQNLALMLGQRLTVLNLSQQSDVADLLGGFKPMDARFICTPLYKEFEYLFSKTFSVTENHQIFSRLQKILMNKDWKKLLKGLRKYVDEYQKKVKKRKKPLDEDWENFAAKLETASRQIASSGMIFSFVEGAFITALRKGEWILLDEVNLAPPETLQRVIGVLEGESGSLCLAERGDVSYINRHPNFRIFACMNPATDAGKRDLPYSLRSRFTEFFVDDVLDDKDLDLFIERFLGESRSNRELIEKIRTFYKAAKKESEERLQDGANQKPQYSLRSLYRALEFTRKAEKKFGFQKALFDGFCMFFLTLLDGSSAKIMLQMIDYLLGKKIPLPVPFDAYLIVNRETSMSNSFLKNYVLTKSVKEHLSNLARAIFVKRYPILLQGPTSSGKTSLVQYLAAITGHEFVRINNHEHTDLQEYLGSYITDACGKLVFHEGVLVKAVRNGNWIVLDELNLAPSDVLEALNRLLDDNRELFVPELCETIKAHPDFMLFATQNPPTFYGGRKMLSRAFRNRFVEIHVDEIPENELSTIIEKRCEIPESYAKKMVEVMKQLQLYRQSSKVFAGKHGFITPRDLFRWANRFKAFGKSYEDLARDGYYILAERLRDEGEKVIVQEVLEKQLRVKIVKDDLYMQEHAGRDSFLTSCSHLAASERLGNIVWTKSMWRLYFLVKRCYELREPVLLVGETGGGKTTVCQVLSSLLGSNLRILNCHQYTETSDFIGGFCPVRDRSKLISEFSHLIERVRSLNSVIHYTGDSAISADIGQASSTLDKLGAIVKGYREGQVSCAIVTLQDIDMLEQLRLDLIQLHQRWQTIFNWQDGPLVEAMKDGSLFLVDEISLADDSVLERLNSVLEPERKLSLAEKGGPVMEKVTAHENFLVLATMNPGGDYGKKELSPALRNRFTEIWVPPVSDVDELRDIASNRIANRNSSFLVDPMLNFWDWFNHLQMGRMLTVRDLLSWVAFINATEKSLGPEYALLHGVFLMLLDGLSLGTGMSKADAQDLRNRCLTFLLEQLKVERSHVNDGNLSTMGSYGWGDVRTTPQFPCGDNMLCNNVFGINPFYVEKGHEMIEASGFEFLAPTTRRNALRVLRAMQLSKPVLLEGSPGVGKTSLVVALGKYSGHKVVRINLSEQTDMMDLLGSDLPIESDEGMKFAWSDGILLQAIKEGCWVLLDELNLAPQSVLEGLNAILDHRGEVFIPEIGLTFKCPSSFRLFACQNPTHQGGGRKGLPRSFLNRFTKVYVDELVDDDYLFICTSHYPSIPRQMLLNLILFNKRLHEETMVYHNFAQSGSPWEFNLRDVIRSCQMIQGAPEKLKEDCFLNILYVQRMRTAEDRREVLRLYEEIFGRKPFINPYPRVQLNSKYLVVGNTVVKRNYTESSEISTSQLKILPDIRLSLEAAAHCVKQEWLCILVGPSSSGKTSLIRLLAQLTGNVLNELNLSSATDISELLGCFEQYNAFRNFRSVVGQVERYVNEYCSLRLESSTGAISSRIKDLISRWLAFLSSVEFTSMTSYTYTENWKCIGNSLSLLVEIIEELRVHVEYTEELNRTMRIISKLQENQQKSYSAKFEWVTGSLIKALENGEWIVLENANLCNPTVLDRINSLVEPSGSITVNECGTVDGKPVIIQPHPNFRMFLTINPSHGEVSRAMRNRGVEIHVMPPYWLFDETNGFTFEDSEIKDVKRFLVLCGIPGNKVVESMAKVHLYAKAEGLRINRKITYFDLARWVQLFQQLLMNGNQPIWSLKVSWEHTYLSSLGEAEGGNPTFHVSNALLPLNELYESGSFLGNSLSMPGGWPMPLKIRDFVWYSKEACVRQNCMYLEFLGFQYASCELENSSNRSAFEQAVPATNLLNVKMLRRIMFPEVSKEIHLKTGVKLEFNSNLAKKMILFAANWVIEQATQSDFQLYRLRFQWLGSCLWSDLSHCPIFNLFLTSLEQELEEPIWQDIFRLHKELTSPHQVDLDSRPIPLLSMEFIDLSAENDMLKMQRRLNAINCVDLLRLNYQQWNAEREHGFSGELRFFKKFFDSLGSLEKGILKIIVGSPSFDELIQLYANLLEDHMLFWDSVVSSKHESSLIAWRALIKDATKLFHFCPGEVEIVQRKGQKLGRLSSWQFDTERSLLWVHGGHPSVPRSAQLYDQQRQLLKFCQSVWQKQVNDRFIDVVASSNYELRSLALQGLCLSSHIAAGSDEDDTQVAQKLEEIYRMLGARFDHERHKLEANSESDEVGLNDTKLASCCNFCPEVLCKKPVFDSWLDTFPISDSTSWFLDMELLQELSQIHLGDETDSQLPQALGTTFDCMESALKYSLALSRRPPQTFVAHQKLLWMLDARMSVDAVKAKVASFVCDMWFWWHSFVWSYHPAALMSFSKTDRHDVTLPDLLFQPMKTATVFHILQSIFPIKDYSLYCLKLRVASCNLWQSCPPLRSLPSSLLSVARSLFCQMIYVHKKTFAGGDYAKIKLRLGSFEKNKVTEKDIHDLSKLIELSSHRRLSSLVDKFIKPLLRELYVHCSSSSGVLQSSLGIAWILMGKLRFHLLLNYDNLDPGMKYSWKCSQLEEKISSIQLDIKVREECNHLAGWLPSREADKKRTDSLQNLEAEHRRLQRKIVYRPDPLKFKSLKKDIDDYFLQHLEKEVVRSPEDLATKIAKGMDLQQSVERVSNWQETASCFIDRLSDGYAEYLDIAQPVQVAVYEMKLGLSLVLSCAFQKLLLNRIGEENIETVMESIHSYMKYPRGAAFDSAVVNLESGQPEFSSQNSNSDSNICEVNLSLLEKLVTLSSNIDSGKGKLLHLKAAVHQNALSRVAHRVANARLMDKDSFEVLHKVFGEFANIWKEMKNEVKAKEDLHSQQFIFRPRAFTINRVFEVDKSTLRKLLANDGFSEWQELLYEEDTENVVVGNDGNESLEEEWGLMQEYILNNMVHLHNQLFGSSDLVLRPGMFRLSDGERVECFMDSYKLGVEMMQGLGGVLSSALDSKLVAEHLLRLCLEHEQKSFSSNSSAQRYNFYKDSNAPVMEKMVKLLTALENRLRSLLNDWEDNPGLQKMLDVTGMLLAIPLTTPLAKSLSGLQILLNKAQMLQETGSKFRISDLLEPITTLVCSWQKMEFESWPALLDEVQYQCESNALKLWFPLSLVLQRTHSTDTAEYDQSIVQSLEEFIHTSSIGEFGRRLVLLFAFLGQFLVGKVLGSYSSPWQEKNLKILYNVFGFYVQFLPEVMEHIGTSRKNIEKEVRDLLKLCRWERSMSVETLRRMRQKLRKLVQKYTDLLQQPAMFILTRGTGQKGVKLLSSEGLKATKENMDASFEMLNSVLDLVQFDDEVRSIWFSNWRNKVTGTLQNFHSRMTQEFSFLEGVAKGAKKLLASQSVDKRYLEEWEKLWQTLEQLCKATRDCGHLWEDEKRSAGKKRALSELLKLLETSGLQKHKFEAMSGDSNRLFLQPYYDSQHLLLVRNRLSHTAADVRVTSKSQSFDDVDTDWKSANEFYFKSLASLQLLQEICLKHHDDISSEQTNRSVSFLNHLIIIQQSQRETAYDMAKHLRRLRECASTLECLYSNCAEDVDKGVGNSCSFARSQHATVDFIWKQKKLFDSLNSMLLEESLLLRTIEKTHLHSCGSVKVTAHMVLGFIEKFIPEIRKAKESLDDYLLGAGEAITVLTHSSHDYVVSKHIEQLALQHFQVIYEFAESLSSFRGQISDGSSVTETLLYRIDDLLRKGISVAEEFKLKLETKNSSINRCEEIGYCNGDYSEPEARFGEALTRTYENIMNVLLKLGSLSNDQARSEDSLGSVTSWEYIFKSSAENLSLDKLRDQLLETISLAGKLENQSGEGNSGLFPRIGAHFKNLHVLVGLVLGFTDSFLQDFLAMHKTVSVLAYALANILASLFSKGFGIPAKGEEDEDNQDKSQDASGTGMGEGVGVKDVSDQITDEDQLLGTSEKEGDEQDASDEKPSKDEKGIEMEQNFDADTYSVSEEDSDGENGDEDGEEEQLESAVGETGENSEVIDEKLWDKEEEKDEENPSKEKEKYEPGSSVKDKNESSRELRAKEDAAAAMADEADELNSDGDDGEKEENVNQDDEIGDAENVDDMKMDKENAFADPTGLDLDEPKDTDEDTNMEENDDPDSKEEVDPDENKDLTENGPDSMEEVAPEDLDENEVGEDVNASTVDEAMRDAENEEADGTSEKDDKTQEAEEENGTDLVSRAGISEFNNDNQVPSSESATRPNSASQASYAQNVAQESNWSNSNEALNDLAPLENFPSGNTSQRDIMVAGSSTSGKLAKDKESLLPPQDVSIQKTEANPYRNIGDALEEWKERVKVSIDLPTDNTDAPSEIMDDDHADEYGYVSEFDKGTAQALGPATSEQLDKNAEGNKPDVDNLTTKKDDVTEMEIDDKATEQQTVEKSAKILRNKMEEQIQQIRDLEKAPMEEYHEAQRDGDLGSASESRVTVKKSYLSEDVHQLNRLSLTDEAPSKAILDEMPSDVKSNASFLWRQYELRTTRLSQELAEQLRLVMEPTLASKLQGDYKTGKRINMKKVIPYIASHYRKDKIWLRRTRPNKRDYQVVIAVDDSRSMSESCCGDVAIEALVTVCRAMAHLEMGNLSVVSFGKKGNIRSLHDFDQPFTGEAGVKMISGLTFKQENTIADEPVVDLLRHLNGMLDTAVANARLPSGQNPLQQLVLIIGDGRFHEKENLKQWVRNLLSKGRMVAFLLLDSSQESILDLQELSFQGTDIKVSKYLDSFPFPYYIVLRNIEALPRTLADLLRQWFEVMQNRRE